MQESCDHSSTSREGHASAAASAGRRVKVAVFGASGYTGAELVRWLLRHPNVQIAAATSRQEAGKRLEDVFPGLRGQTDLAFSDPDAALTELASPGALDFAFLALPAGASFAYAPRLLDAGVRVIDLGADFRLRDPDAYRRWYGLPHGATHLLAEAVYGLADLHGAQIAGARLVANPGCYPTAVALALAPLLRRGLAHVGPGGAAGEPVIIHALSGVSGAGASPQPEYQFALLQGNFWPYKVGSHRHTPEMEQELSALAGGSAQVKVLFVPNLVPAVRGILATCYVRPAPATRPARRPAAAGIPPDAPLDTQVLLALYAEFYGGNPAIQVLPEPALPQAKAVAGTPNCQLAVRFDPHSGYIVAMAALDNLAKGAATQAIQNMNLMAGFPPLTGLEATAQWP